MNSASLSMPISPNEDIREAVLLSFPRISITTGKRENLALLDFRDSGQRRNQRRVSHFMITRPALAAPLRLIARNVKRGRSRDVLALPLSDSCMISRLIRRQFIG
jgi:hypothetical protein